MSAITLDVPREFLLNANQRLHWRRKAERSHWLRQAAYISTAGSEPYVGRQHCQVAVDWPDRRRRDVHNLMPTIKACIDGMVDAGLLADDSDQHLVGPDLRVSDRLCDKRYACTLTFRFTPVEVTV